MVNNNKKNYSLGCHDCVGGCDGCIDFENESNNGLANIVANLTGVYNTGGYSVSLADFYAFASTVAVDVGIDNSNRRREDEGLR